MTLDGLSRARDIEALGYLQQQYAPGGQTAAFSDRNSRASSKQTEFDEALPPLGLSETPARVARGRHAGDYSPAHRSCGHLIPRERRSSKQPRFTWHWTLRPSGADPGTSMKAWSHVHGFARSLG
jgi:hypothetical protein